MGSVRFNYTPNQRQPRRAGSYRLDFMVGLGRKKRGKSKTMNLHFDGRERESKTEQ
ncbi:conserved hypothetical protein [Ricinus communis]|uniref:Uncharacterized protein n=1 Tax=Ricinus communis TaxID=3988 RepID=B9SWR5_RICCO|nr:conserved hypothetical protein [Ricinus communis]